MRGRLTGARWPFFSMGTSGSSHVTERRSHVNCRYPTSRKLTFRRTDDGSATTHGRTSMPQVMCTSRATRAFDRREQVSSENGAAPAWRRDGRELYYVEDASADGPLRIRMMAVPITTTPTFSAGAPRVLFEGPFRTDGPFRGYDVTLDGQRFLMVREIAQPPARLPQMVLVQNWFEELKRVVPAK